MHIPHAVSPMSLLQLEQTSEVLYAQLYCPTPQLLSQRQNMTLPCRKNPECAWTSAQQSEQSTGVDRSKTTDITFCRTTALTVITCK